MSYSHSTGTWLNVKNHPPIRDHYQVDQDNHNISLFLKSVMYPSRLLITCCYLVNLFLWFLFPCNINQQHRSSKSVSNVHDWLLDVGDREKDLILTPRGGIGISLRPELQKSRPERVPQHNVITVRIIHKGRQRIGCHNRMIFCRTFSVPGTPKSCAGPSLDPSATKPRTSPVIWFLGRSALQLPPLVR